MKRLGCSAIVCVVVMTACSFKDNRTYCSEKSPCDPGHRCVDGFCLIDSEDDGGKDPPRGSAAVGGGGSGGVGGRTGMTTNPNTMMDGGAGRDAATDGSMPEAGSSSPRPCRAGETRRCMLPGSSAERCRAGTQRCEDGSFGSCIAETEPSPEECNEVDDDCDGKTDEIVEICYPGGTAGCTVAEGRAAQCVGICFTGTRQCIGGEFGPCTGATTPQTEVCTSTGGAAADENCDGSSDEVCACSSGESRACYTAASATLDVGTCRAGTQVCTNGVLGACMGAVVPVEETCLNENSDDDCDGTVDDIVGRGAPCSVASNMGVCRSGVFQCQSGRAELTCVTPMPTTDTCNSLDDDCDGRVDETVNLQTDNANCGACGMACTTGQSCCAGVCRDTQTDNAHCGGCAAANVCQSGSSCCSGQCVDTTRDANNCGGCGTPCGTGLSCCTGQCVNTQTDLTNCGECGTTCTTGTQPGCCTGDCVDLVSREHCGSCDTACGLELLCECSMTPQGAMCVEPIEGVCI